MSEIEHRGPPVDPRSVLLSPEESAEGTYEPSAPEDWINDSFDVHPGDHPASFFLGKEFLLWLWWKSERAHGAVELEGVGTVEFWIDDRIQFRTEGDQPQVSDLKGGQPSATAEARSALQAGKIVETARIGMRVGEREYALSLKGETLEIAGLKLPAEVQDGLDERIYERMFLLDEVVAILDALFFQFIDVRLDPEFARMTLEPIREWVAGD